MKDKIIDYKGRYIIILCQVQGTEYLLVNVYAPNIESQQVHFLTQIEECIASLNISPNVMTVWGGDFNCHLQNIDADGGRCVTKKNSVHKIETLMSKMIYVIFGG